MDPWMVPLSILPNFHLALQQLIFTLFYTNYTSILMIRRCLVSIEKRVLLCRTINYGFYIHEAIIRCQIEARSICFWYLYYSNSYVLAFKQLLVFLGVIVEKLTDKSPLLQLIPLLVQFFWLCWILFLVWESPPLFLGLFCYLYQV